MMLDFLVLLFALLNVSLCLDPFFLMSGPPSNVIYRLDKSTKAYADIPIVHRQPSTVQYDRKTGRIFFGAVNQNHVFGVELDGSDSREETSQDMYAQAMALDDSLRYLFVYSPSQTSSVWRIPLDEVNNTMGYSLIIDNISQNITHMAADPITRTLYMGSDHGLYLCSYNGTGMMMILNNTNNINGITFDDTYVFTISGNIIWKIKRSNNKVQQLFTIPTKSNEDAQGLAAVDGHLYFGLNYCDKGPASLDCDIYIYRVLKDGTQYGVFSALIRTPYCSMLKLIYIEPLQRNETSTTPCPEDISGTCIHVVDDNFSDDSTTSSNTLALCLILIPLALFLSAIGIFFCWKKMSKPQMCGEGDAAINETLHSGQYLELREENKF